jgi:hypothetical protein
MAERAEPAALAPAAAMTRRSLPDALYLPEASAAHAGIGFLALGVMEAAVATRLLGSAAPVWSGRRVPAELRAFVAQRPERRLLVIGLAHRLTVARVESLLADAGDLDGRIGVVSGRSAEAIAHSLAKLAAVPRIDLAPLEVFDAVAHHLDHRSADADGLRARLIRPARVKILRCHGEGSHAKFAGLTVCGLLDRYEFDAHPDIGCSRPDERCKRAPPVAGRKVVFGSEIGAQVVFFLCCNGFNLARELYPSPVSIALSLIEGQAAAVVAPTRPVIVPDAVLRALIGRVEAGGRLGEIVEALNAAYRVLDGCAPFVVHGDPGIEIAASVGRAAAPARAPGLRPGSPDAEVLQATAELQRRLVQLRANAGRSARVLDSVRAAAPMVELAPLDTALANLKRLALYALKRCETVLDADQLRPALRDEGLIGALVQRLDVQLARTLVAARRHIDPFDLFHYDQIREGAAHGAPCERCGTATRILRFGATAPEADAREGLECPVCGPKAEQRCEGLTLTVAHRFEAPMLHLGLAARPPTVRVARYAAVALRFFDKAQDRCAASLDEIVELGAAPLECALALPADLSPDLHSVRLVAASGLDLAYVRLRVAGGPPSPEAPGSERVQ